MKKCFCGIILIVALILSACNAAIPTQECPSCSAEISNSMKFCPNCGIDVSNVEKEVDVETELNSENNSTDTETVSPPQIEKQRIINITLADYIEKYNSMLRNTVSNEINTNVTDSDYISCAKTLLNKALKNPSTAQYNNASVYEKDDYGRAIVYLDVSAQNGFGGWVRSEYYVCIQSVDEDGTFRYNSTVPYTDEKSGYNTLLLINDFGENPVDNELEGLLIDENKVDKEGSFPLSASKTLDNHKLIMDLGIQFISVDSANNNIVSIQFSIKDSANKIDCEKVISAVVAALADIDMSKAKNNITNVITFSTLTPTSNPIFYDDGVVYDCAYGFSGVDIAVTIVDENTYNSGIYWTPNNEETYYELLADQYAEIKDYDNAIVFYEEAMISGDKLLAAYYGKAEKCLASGDLDTAGQYFRFAGDYKDSAVRVLEVYYSAGKKHEQNNDYISAINSYQMAGNFSDANKKYKECSFKQGEKYANNKQYVEAISCFESAADYSNAEEKCKEACYLYAEQQLLVGALDSASSYFTKAGDYKDASTKMQKYYYEQGNNFLASKDYIKASECFNKIIGYSDSQDKYKEANYLHGETLLSAGNVESAKTYYYNAKGYKDADTRIQRYYYENGKTLLNAGNFLTAAEKFILSGIYSDSKMMELECYYQYGKQQLSLNYISNATGYLSKCRGYKDTDEILLSYYYGEASKAFDVLIASYSANDFTWRVDDAYKDAVNKLALCEGYSNSTTLSKIADKTYYVWTEMQYESNFEASLSGMTVTYSESQIMISRSKFMGGSGGNLNLTYDLNNDTFSATITDLFSGSAREFDVRKVICAMLKLFTSIQDTDDFNKQLETKNNWVILGNNESFSMSYGGYTISINTTETGNYNLNCTITASK